MCHPGRIDYKTILPEGPARHLDAARQKLPRDNFCRSVAAQLPTPRGQFRKREKSPLLWARGNLGGILRDNLGEGNCEAKIAARQRGVNFKKREGVPEMGTKPLKALRGYRASNRGSENL